ncbi:MAG: ATP-binding protein [Candidatus Diapherotrites archaeon]|uniref:ATP-binding protein n=1 Tax=Candidatus Iainarchaeum sp. TaxID=3101447 RepID=A0A8T5GEU2_9ARCH|nr:ATP-binding protein [Candidatus Diapherotrites archaeon]MBT7240924.1 ATP-binding protein [Candidatus Diapherotrites archaeon]
MKKIVIAGGQGSGKTTVIDKLKKDFCCIHEATSYLIDSGYVPEDHSFEEFQNEVITKQKEMENSVDEKIVFLDRCLIDTILYLEEEEKEESDELLLDIKNANYNQVFFLDALPEKYWPMPAHKKPRITTYQKGIERTKKLFEIYDRFNIPIKKIPAVSLDERIKLIKEIINKLEE